MFSGEFKRICVSYGLQNCSAFGRLSFSAIRICVITLTLFGIVSFVASAVHLSCVYLL